MKEIKAYLTDRFAQAIREANPNIGDASYARAEFYANEVYRYIIEKNDEKEYQKTSRIYLDEYQPSEPEIETDNFFYERFLKSSAKWAKENAEESLKLGEGRQGK